MEKLRHTKHYERVYSEDEEGNKTYLGVKTKYEEVQITKKRRNLTPEQLSYMNRNDELNKYCRSLGGYVHMLYVKNEILFNTLDIDRSNISRLIYLATYIDYNNREENVLIKRTNNNKIEYLNKSEIKKLMNLSDRAFSSFMQCMLDNKLLFEVNNKFYITNEYFGKGESSFDDKHYTRVFISTTRKLYEGCSSRQHKKLSYVFQLIPFLNYETNVLCDNPNELNKDKLHKLNLKEICKKLNISTQKSAMSRFEHSLYDLQIKIDDKKYYLFSRVIIKGKNGHNDYFVINPAVIWNGSNVSNAKETIEWMCFKN